MAENTTRVHRAGLFDIRFIIAVLLGLYGLIVLINGLFTSDAQLEKADGLNINLYAGIGMLVVAAVFVVWARVRPIVVPVDPDEPSHDGPVADTPAVGGPAGSGPVADDPRRH